jgi:four helix bundle protein
MKKNIVLDMSFEFALMTVKLHDKLVKQKEFILSKQLLRSGTSVGANIREANNTNTLKDFIYKFNIAQKECDESLYWLELLYASDKIESDEFVLYSDKAKDIHNVIKCIIGKSKLRLAERKSLGS